ncbi:class A beta-lactamase-related serine hydrolase [Fibrisoma montanum]|uniref:Class A beta-lactamase-related serine hydrolase n=1 Tax=Fibrisoma montanum TaxID=2305895 RepID=A0A418LWT5_9BACT|nr:serine hydrolase domain-containing protein [Fibrisoma montanum]RIV17717.1 class A beta-lactamase-related serine hydrolase [Fibrisoma montanum]
MKTRYILTLLPVLLAGCESLDVPQSPAEPCSPVSYVNHPRHQTYLAELQQYRRKANAPGSLLLIQKPGEPRWIGAVGKSNLAYQTDLRVCDQFRVGSITKMFVAVATLKLQEQGKLRLDDRLATLLPGLKGRIPQADQITVRHLLSHTSGIVDPPNESIAYQLSIVDDYQARFKLTTEQLLTTYVYGKPLHFTPGTAWSYSNANYWLLGQIIEQKTGQRLHEVLDGWIFRPLGMNDTYLDVRDDRNVVRGYADLYGNGRLYDVSHWDRADTDGGADGGIISTAADLATFADALFNGNLLAEGSLSEMVKPTLLPTCPSGDCEYGLGVEHWKTGLGTAYGHNGGSVGIEANLLFFPKNKGIFVLYKNNGNGSDKSLMDRLMP